jgi:hypothetical protein
MHRTANFFNLAACSEMSNRGFVVLCMNTRFDNNESQVIFEQTALDVKAGVNFSGKINRDSPPGITKVVTLGIQPWRSGHELLSGGGRVGSCLLPRPHKLVKCDGSGSTSFVGLPPADGIVFVDAQPGVAQLEC